MTEDVNDLIHATRDEGPRPGFLDELRATLVEELESIEQSDRSTSPISDRVAVVDDVAADDDVVVDDDIVIIELQTDIDDRGGPGGFPTWLPAAAALVGIAIVAWLLIGLYQDDSGVDTIDDPQEQTETDDNALGADGQVVELAGVDIDSRFGFDLAPGTYRTDTVGATVSFTVEADTQVAQNGEAILAFGSEENRVDQTITLRRLAALPQPSALTEELSASGWPVADLDGWLDELDNGVLIEVDTEATIGGMAATRIILEIGELGCGTSEGCQRPVSRSFEVGEPLFADGARYQLWFVEAAEEDPLVIVKAIENLEDVEWLESDDAIIASFEIETVGPNPWRILDAGPVELEAFGGIRLDLPEDGIEVIEANGSIAHFNSLPIASQVFFITSPTSFEGEPIVSVEQMREIFAERFYVLEERLSFTVDGVEVQSFRAATGTSPQESFFVGVGGVRGWAPSGDWWVIEDPELGLLIVEHSFGGPIIDAESVWVDELLMTLEFLDRE